MPEHLNAYDSGYRLEPKPWPTGAGAASDDFGKVDFTDEFGETVFTGWMQRTEAGYILRVDEHQDVELGFETSSQRQTREAAMTHLDQSLRGTAAQHENAVSFYEGDPDAFGAGHYVIENTAQDQRLVINEQYVGTDSSDPDRVPNSWTIDVEHYTTIGSSRSWQVLESREVSPAEVDSLCTLVTDWTQTQARQQATLHALMTPPSQTQQQDPGSVSMRGEKDITYGP